MLSTVISMLGGGTGLLSFYYARMKRESMAIENLKQVISEIKDVHSTYKAETDAKIERLNQQVIRMHERSAKQNVAISQSYRCTYPPTGSICPVVELIQKAMNAEEEEP